MKASKKRVAAWCAVLVVALLVAYLFSHGFIGEFHVKKGSFFSN